VDLTLTAALQWRGNALSTKEFNMAKRKRNSTTSPHKPRESNNSLCTAISKCTKAELVDLVLELAEADRRLLRQITARFDVARAPSELVAATHQAIVDATAFDKREINRNFNYDYAAYEEVKRNFGRLIGAGQLLQVMELSLELMKRGSYQVEMSDEGLMTQDIEDCLSVVLESLRNCDLPALKVIEWCSAMLRSDRSGFIATNQLHSLRKASAMRSDPDDC